MFKRHVVFGLSALFGSIAVQAAPISYWENNGYTQFRADGEAAKNGYVNPGWGGQDFDAEFLYYKYDASTNHLSIGLQTGFDVVTGKVRHNNRDYYAGDLALSFDNTSGYEYAVDFGLLTRDYHGLDAVDADNNGDGIDEAGFYSVAAWNNDIYFNASSPFAMDEGTKDADIVSDSGYDLGEDTYYRTATFDVSSLNLGDNFGFDAHWTMNCGNDVIDGNVVSVPEPGSLPLIALGLVAITLLRRKVA